MQVEAVFGAAGKKELVSMRNGNCRLIVDSDSDVPQQILNDAGVEFFSLPYDMDDGEHFDDLGVSMKSAEFYKRMRAGENVTTAALPVTKLEEKFEECARDGTPTVYLALSSKLSSTYGSAEQVAQQVRERNPGFELYLVDSKLISVAEGFLDYEAIRQYQRGLTAKQLAAWAETARWYVNCLFTVDDLEYLRRGGRIPSAAASIGTKLKVNPTLSFDVEGNLSMTGVARGRKKALKLLVSSFAECHPDGARPDETVLVASADAEADADWVEEHLERPENSIPALRWDVGPSIGAHVGPGMVAVVCWGPDRRDKTSFPDQIADQVTAADRAEGEKEQGE